MSDIVMGVHGTNRSESELFRRVSWGAIFSGAFVALGMELVFLTFGMFIGFQMTGGGALPWTTAWYLVSVFFSLFVGGFIAARLAGNPNRGNGMVHGFVVWGLTMFTTAAVALTLLWDVVRAAGLVLRNAVETAPAATGAVTQGNLTHAAHVAAGDVSATAIVVFGGLVLAMIGAMVGGAAAAPKEIDFVGASRPNLPEQSPHHA